MKINEIKDPDVVERSHRGWLTTSSRIGRTQMRTDCPFCGTRVNGYAWSLAGHGFKKCSCGAIIGYRTACYQKKDQIKADGK